MPSFAGLDLLWYLYLGIATRGGAVDGGYYLRNVGLDQGPSPFSQGDYCDLAAGKILLILEIAVSGDDHVKPCGFRGHQKLSVLQFVPSPRASFGYGVMIDQITGKIPRRSVVKQHEHLRTRRGN